MAMNLKKDLQTVNQTLNALTKKIEKMIVTVGKLEKPAAKAKPAKKTASKKPAAKTAPATVLEIIKRSKKGVDLETLKKKTGFNNKKISNNVYRLKKQGKIKASEKGVYVKA